MHAKLTPRRSGARGHADHGWLDTYHTFSFGSYWDPRHSSFGALRVLNEDRVAPGQGFPTHPHRDAEIFSYILRGELTHRDSMVAKGAEATTGASKDAFYRMHRGDVQFTTGGSGIAHSETNEHAEDWVHFLQIWATPWARGLNPRYHTRSFDEAAKKERFVPILSPLRAGPGASAQEESESVPTVPNTIPVHADLLFAAGIIGEGKTFEWGVGGSQLGTSPDDKAVRKDANRHVYVHVTMTGGGKSKVRVNGSEELAEGDGCYVENVRTGDLLKVESIGSAAAEVVVLDSE
jgi:quercetin 2,3-dioxygenase